MTLDPELQRLIESARQADLPDDARLARVRERLVSQVGPPGSEAVSATQTGAGTHPAASGVGLAIKTAGILSAIGLAVWSVQQLPRRDAEVRPPVRVERSDPPARVEPGISEAGASAPLQPSAAGAPDEVERPTPHQTRARSQVRERAAPEAPEDAFAAELALMQQAVQAQRAGRIARARALVAEHARRYPRGALRAERERLAAQLAAGNAAD